MIEINHLKNETTVPNPKYPSTISNECETLNFQFDTIFNEIASQEDLYRELGFPIIEKSLAGLYFSYLNL